jgi:hypothetical protein
MLTRERNSEPWYRIITGKKKSKPKRQNNPTREARVSNDEQDGKIKPRFNTTYDPSMKTLKNTKVTEVTTHSRDREIETEGLSGGLEHESIEIHKTKEEFQLEDKPGQAETPPRVTEHRKRYEMEEERGEGSLERRREHVTEEEKEYDKKQRQAKHAPVRHRFHEVRDDYERPVDTIRHPEPYSSYGPTTVVKDGPPARVIYSESTPGVPSAGKWQTTDQRALKDHDYTAPAEQPSEGAQYVSRSDERPRVVHTSKEATPGVTSAKLSSYETAVPSVVSTTAVSPRPSIRYYRDVTSREPEQVSQLAQDQREEEEEQEERLHNRKKDTERKEKERQREVERAQDLERHQEEIESGHVTTDEEMSKAGRVHPKARLDVHRRKPEPIEPRTVEEPRPAALPEIGITGESESPGIQSENREEKAESPANSGGRTSIHEEESEKNRNESDSWTERT